MIRLHMLSGPRNISTTMMRSFENRPDTAVVDEPFYASWLARSGVDHPYRKETLAAQPNDPAGVVDWLQDSPARFGKPDAAILFCKHIAYHIEDPSAFDFLIEGRCFLLIRDPRRMVASFAQKFEDVEPIVQSFGVERRLYNDLEERGRPCPVVDAADVVADPDAMLRALCAALDIPYTEKMLAWPSGPRESDGVWGPHWYDAVKASTGFNKPVEKPVELSPRLAAIAERCREDYAFLQTRRLKA
ncbi:MAG: hypothetical protein RIE56_10870 [Amphiplicatus sp.]